MCSLLHCFYNSIQDITIKRMQYREVQFNAEYLYILRVKHLAAGFLKMKHLTISWSRLLQPRAGRTTAGAKYSNLFRADYLHMLFIVEQYLHAYVIAKEAVHLSSHEECAAARWVQNTMRSQKLRPLLCYASTYTKPTCVLRKKK